MHTHTHTHEQTHTHTRARARTRYRGNGKAILVWKVVDHQRVDRAIRDIEESYAAIMAAREGSGSEMIFEQVPEVLVEHNTPFKVYTVPRKELPTAMDEFSVEHFLEYVKSFVSQSKNFEKMCFFSKKKR